MHTKRGGGLFRFLTPQCGEVFRRNVRLEIRVAVAPVDADEKAHIFSFGR